MYPFDCLIYDGHNYFTVVNGQISVKISRHNFNIHNKIYNLLVQNSLL